jgi:hypothetical protein
VNKAPLITPIEIQQFNNLHENIIRPKTLSSLIGLENLIFNPGHTNITRTYLGADFDLNER